MGLDDDGRPGVDGADQQSRALQGSEGEIPQEGLEESEIDGIDLFLEEGVQLGAELMGLRKRGKDQLEEAQVEEELQVVVGPCQVGGLEVGEDDSTEQADEVVQQEGRGVQAGMPLVTHEEEGLPAPDRIW